MELIAAAAVLVALVYWLGVDLTVTAANVERYADGAVVLTHLAGETITAGQAVFRDADTGSATYGKILKTDANDGTRQFLSGISLNGAAAGQPVAYQTAGDIDVGATLAIGTIYVASATQGGMAPHGDLVTGWKLLVIGAAVATDKLRLIPGMFKPGATVP